LKIDAALLERVPFRNIAKRYGVGTSSLFRHAREHLPMTLAEEARDSVDVLPLVGQINIATPASGATVVQSGVDTEALVNHLGELHDNTLGILRASSAAGRHETALKAVREARGNVELTARLSGLLKDAGAPPVHVQIGVVSGDAVPTVTAVKISDAR
jgi:hypothetical protein